MSLLSLPNEMIEMIFKQLNDLNEMLNCKLVSMRCKQLVDRIRLKGSLAVQIVSPKNDFYYADYADGFLRPHVQRYQFTWAPGN